MTQRTAIVTGGARGIGAAISKRLAKDGLAVAVVDIREEDTRGVVEEINAAGGQAIGIGADITDEAAANAAVEKIAEELGAPTVLINNAGIIRDHMLFKMPLADFQKVLAVHLEGNFIMTKAAQKYMVQENFGRIISMSSTSALGNRGQANYSAAKAGIQGLTKTYAIELGRYGVTANAIAPGFIETDMTKATAESVGVSFEEFTKAAAAQIDVRRTGKPEDIAHTASFLASEGAGFVSGQVIYVAGGPKN
ncbi:SDR family oxidoreductase [Brevibacterium sp. 50QC2O2]|jgi:3-oxoacyl-[acyl-carrier protein] reductase|uniref:SDR family oxidoreductase n=1 Tax=Brevibacterium TaxID=1696 RepID=UPI00211CEC23|nr:MULTISPECIES: SDR family NAD(P)-dependent oxidoreductase [unclassified Brevibacterium]MCQ9368985.1 SDR family oxidoreductase [Brevibacterium sp. 91QC2O2]MCQ9384213.1 SDR family oxidoreductase [Brevibacterium sp. 68QC2CO]MCQ9388308.1 SDR family oxidoreductase [Brevibacterium sp. 50QC2O2]